MSLPIRKGLVWLSVAFIADVLPLVSGQFHVPVCLSPFFVVGVYLFEPKRLFCFFIYLVDKEY
jgi:hypothetical protein